MRMRRRQAQHRRRQGMRRRIELVNAFDSVKCRLSALGTSTTLEGHAADRTARSPVFAASGIPPFDNGERSAGMRRSISSLDK
jgi:hypothetical protein